MKEHIVVTVEGSVSTDGDDVYVGGMSLARIIRASMPGVTEASYTPPNVTIRVELTFEAQ